jgi:hypothetical protein
MHAYLAPGLEPGPPLDKRDPIDSYLRVVRWAAWRYSDRYGTRLVVEEAGKPTRYARIEAAAFRRFMATDETDETDEEMLARERSEWTDAVSIL